MERTFVAVKPDGVQRGLCGEIMKRFEQRGFRLVAAKFMQVSDGGSKVKVHVVSHLVRNSFNLD